MNNAIVSTDWLYDHIDDPNLRIIESNEDNLLYHLKHIPRAVHIDWTADLNDPIRRDYLSKNEFEALCSSFGITKDTTLIFYGDKNNWWAAYALWVFSLFGHKDLRILDGGRVKWEKDGLPMIEEVPHFPASKYVSEERDDATNRAFRDDVLNHLDRKGTLIDVRSPDEYSGKRLHMPDYPNEGALRGGHIPTAKNIPWASAVNTENGTFKSIEELKSLYQGAKEIPTNAEVVTYCRIGERSAHTWFVMKYLLGYKNVRNYDGSWTEWGNLVGAPIEK